MSAPAPEWSCEAYGPEGSKFGALCFVSAVPGTRLCKSAVTCGLQMADQRRRVFARIHELASLGDPDAQYLAGEFPTPEMLLNGLRETAGEDRS